MATITKPAATPTGTRGRLPAASRDRRPALAALALLLMLSGALASALIVYRSGDRADVLVAARDISAGEEIVANDFRVARVATDGALSVPSEAVGNFVGAVATTGIPEGTLVNNLMFLTGSVVPDDAAVVGVVLTASQRPAKEPEAGDVVRVFVVPRDDGSGTETSIGSEIVSAAKVVEVSGGGANQSMALSLLVPQDEAPVLVAAAATNQVAVTRLSDDTEPAVDFRQD